MKYGLALKTGICAGICVTLIPLIASESRADAITDWNAQLTKSLRIAGVPIGRQPRQAAIVHAAMFDAVNGIAGKYNPFFVQQWAPGGAREEAAAVQAGYTSLVGLFPAQKPALDVELAKSLAKISGTPGNSQSIAKGRVWGEKVANAILSWRSTDGYNTPATPYFGSAAIGHWRPAPPNETLPAVFQELAVMTPFVMSAPWQFRPEAPPALTSPEYAADLNEVKAIGQSTSATRTAYQTLAAKLWHAVDAADENDAIRAIAVKKNTRLVDNARMFALVNVAGADTFIYVCDAKVTYDYWRPIHAIRLADLDGNPLTSVDSTWSPLFGTPRHQEYVSGHSSLTGAHFRIVMNLLGNNTKVTLQSPALPGASLTYTNLSDAIVEVGSARVWGGIHFRTACNVGGRDGQKIADYIMWKVMTPRK